MAKDPFMASRRPSVASGYGMLRGLVRLWTSAFFRKMRAIEAEFLPESSPALFIVSHPGSFLDAVLLVAATNRQVHCLVDRNLLHGALRKLLAWGLEMIPYEREGDGWRRAVEAASNVLGRARAVAAFAEFQAAESADASPFARTAATIALEAESRNANQLGVRVVPVHLFLPVARLHSSELMVYFDRRIPPEAYLYDGKSPAEKRQALCAALEEACRQNVFRLRPEDVGNFLSDLEQVLREDLEEEFAMRPHGKQKAEGFELSGFIVEWAEKLNFLHPGRLIALRESLGEYRQARRRAALERFEIETAGAWLNSALRRGAGWAETLVGFPAAFYGLLNHLLAAALLRGAGLLKKQTETDRVARWTTRVVLVLACYAGQIFLCDHFLGRAAAGTYALSLPISGLYLWRYGWLLRHRTRLLLRGALAPRRAARGREMRKDFVKELNAARDAYVEALELAH